MTKKKIAFLALMVAATPYGVAAQDQVRVLGVTAAVGGPTTLTLARNSPERQYVTTTSPLITRTLVLAYMSDTAVKLDLLPDTAVSDAVVKRVNPFAVGRSGPRLYPRDYRISRIATQRKPDGSDEHLEVFVLKGQDPDEKAYNVYDPRIIEVLLTLVPASTAPQHEATFDLVADGALLVEVTAGERRK